MSGNNNSDFYQRVSFNGIRPTYGFTSTSPPSVETQTVSTQTMSLTPPSGSVQQGTLWKMEPSGTETGVLVLSFSNDSGQTWTQVISIEANQ